jgi:hypothetical protein
VLHFDSDIAISTDPAITFGDLAKDKGNLAVSGELHSEVPETLAGARVLDTQALAELLEQGNLVLIGAAEVPHRPDNLSPSAIWMPARHQNIPGSIWIPGIGDEKIEPEA